MQQEFGATRNSSLGLGQSGPQLRSAALSKSASRLSGERITPRRDPATDDRMRMIRVMIESAEKMMVRLGIVVPAAESLPAQA